MNKVIVFSLLAITCVLLYTAFQFQAKSRHYAALVPQYQSDCRSTGVISNALLTQPNGNPPPCYQLLLPRKILRIQKLGGGGSRSKGYYSYTVYVLEQPSFSFFQSSSSRGLRREKDPIGEAVPLSQTLNWGALSGREEFNADRTRSAKTVSCDVEVWRMKASGTGYTPWSGHEYRSQEVTRIRAAGQDIEAQNHPAYQSRYSSARAAFCFGLAIAFGLPLLLVILVRVFPVKVRMVFWVIYVVCGVALGEISGRYMDTHFR